MPPAPHPSERIKTSIVLAYTARKFSYEWGIWPSDEKLFLSPCRKIFEHASAQATLDATIKSPGVKRVLKAIVTNRERIAIIQAKTGRAVWRGQQPPVGYMWKNAGENQQFFFDSRSFQNMLGAQHHSYLKDLKQYGFLKGAGRKQPRLDSKPPVNVPTNEHGYDMTFPKKVLEILDFESP